MSLAATQIDLTGGESVYCINAFQLAKAVELYESAPDGPVRLTVDRLEQELSRNERAAVAMVLLERLRNSRA